MIGHKTRCCCITVGLLLTTAGEAHAAPPSLPIAPTPAAPTVVIQEFPAPWPGAPPAASHPAPMATSDSL